MALQVTRGLHLGQKVSAPSTKPPQQKGDGRRGAPCSQTGSQLSINQDAGGEPIFSHGLDVLNSSQMHKQSHNGFQHLKPRSNTHGAVRDETVAQDIGEPRKPEHPQVLRTPRNRCGFPQNAKQHHRYQVIYAKDTKRIGSQSTCIEEVWQLCNNMLSGVMFQW